MRCHLGVGEKKVFPSRFGRPVGVSLNGERRTEIAYDEATEFDSLTKEQIREIVKRAIQRDLENPIAKLIVAGKYLPGAISL
jgi:hypothetical protein